MKTILLSITSCLIIIFSFTVSGQVVINEYSASNRNIIADNNGDYEDYLELYNTTGSSVSLSGWYLSDNFSNVTKWTFPSTASIPANGFLKVWLSNKDTVIGTNYHTSFKLTQTKNDVIALSNPSSIIVDSVTLQLTQKNHSRGRTTNGGSTWGIFTSPTPGTSNGASFSYYVAKPVANVAPGFYSSAVTVTLTVSDPNATIRYTTDGTKPTTLSTAYTVPINIASTTTLRARAFSSVSGTLASFEEVNTYFINESHDPRYYVIAVADDKYDQMFNSWGTWDIDSYFELFGKDAHPFICEGEGKVDPHGNDSWAFPQKGIDFEMEDDYGYAHDIPHTIFSDRDRPSFDHLILKAGASDNYPFSWGDGPCHMRDAYIQTLAIRQKADVDVRTYEPAALYINGEYWGIYEIREKMDEPDFTDYYYKQKEKHIDVLAFWGGLNVKYGSGADWNSLYYYMQANSMANSANYNYVNDRLNFTSMIDNMVINTYTVNCDWINWNTMWWRGRNPNGDRQKWTYSFWDEDNILGLGQNYSGWPTTTANAGPCDLSASFQNVGPNMGHLEMLNWLLVNPDFKNLYINRYADLMNTTLSCDTMTAMLDQFVDLIGAEMPKQVARWGGSITGWETNVGKLKTFITDRCAKIDSLMVDCYDVTGPYDITVSVSPPLAGTVKVSSLNLTNFPWYGTYFGDVDLNFKATVKPGNNMEFDHWEVNNNVVSPNINADSITINLQADDQIVAVFKNILPAFALTVNVVPASSGTVTIETTTPATYPYSSSYLSGDEINLSANPDGDFVFDYWELDNHFVNPNSITPDVNFTLYTSDVVTAHFRPYTGISTANITSLQVYPTLTQDKFFIAYELTQFSDLNIRLYSLSGQLVKNLTAENPELKNMGRHETYVSMKEGQLSPGVYFLQLEQPGFNKTFKIVMLPH